MDTAEPTGRNDAALTGAALEELAWLRAENAFLRVQLDVLTDIATGYAHDLEVILGRHAAEVSRR